MKYVLMRCGWTYCFQLILTWCSSPTPSHTERPVMAQPMVGTKTLSVAKRFKTYLQRSWNRMQACDVFLDRWLELLTEVTQCTENPGRLRRRKRRKITITTWKSVESTSTTTSRKARFRDEQQDSHEGCNIVQPRTSCAKFSCALHAQFS